LREVYTIANSPKKIAKNALTILINLSTDTEVLEFLATDIEFVKILLDRLTVCAFCIPLSSCASLLPPNDHISQKPKEPNANEISMLLANLAKHDSLVKIFSLEKPAPPELHSNNIAIDQLLDLFVKGADGTYNKEANFDYLSYLFADLAKHAGGRQYFLTKQSYDSVVPLAKLIVFTEHPSHIRRRGVASTIKNTAFETNSHDQFLSEDDIHILPYLLLPIMGNEVYSEEDSENMLPELQLLPEDKKRESDCAILQTHVETLMLLTTTRLGRDVLREASVYPIIRETHLQVEDDGVREVCERLVQVLMRDEEGEKNQQHIDGMEALERPENEEKKKPFGRLQAASGPGTWARAEESDESGEEDDKIVEV
jgi:hypothetical protein